MKIISTFVHGVVDYAVGVALLVAPNLFGFAESGGAAVMVPRIVGVLILVQNVLTAYELGWFKVLPMTSKARRAVSTVGPKPAIP
jgi:hypothetical protein